MFGKSKNRVKLCADFKAAAIKASELGNTSITLGDLETFFNYKSSNLVWGWMPKLIRDELRRIGVFLRKQRGKNNIEITISG